MNLNLKIKEAFKIPEYLQHGSNESLIDQQDANKSFIQNMEFYDKVVNEIYDNHLFSDGIDIMNDHGELQKLNYEIKFQPDSGDSINFSTINTNLQKMLSENSELQQKILNNSLENAKTTMRTYNKSADMHRTQEFHKNVMNEEVETIETRNEKLGTNLSNSQRQLEINNYYYKKNKAQVRILFNILYLCLTIYVLTFLNKHLSFIFNDTAFVILLGIILGIFFIYFCLALYDIYARDDDNFDEYSYFWRKSVNDLASSGLPKELLSEDLDFSVCDKK